MAYTNSPLVDYTKISPNSTNPRKDKIKKITIHHMAGNLSIEACGNVFQNRSRQASSNYGIGTDGRVGLYVEEKNRAWTSSSAENDNQAVTIEVANDKTGGDWHVSDKALEKTIELCVDICKRNGIKSLNFTGDRSGNLTMHRYFAATTCPGDYLASKFPYIASEVNKRLNETSTPTIPTTSTKPIVSEIPVETNTYTVQKGDTLSKIGKKTGIAWKTIANLNGIKFPYIIKVGQVLKLSESVEPVKTSSFNYNGLDYSLVFNPTYYANKYPDVKKACGNDAIKLFQHFTKHGMLESRQGSVNFNVEIYKKRYPDLRKEFVGNMPEYYKHYVKYGYKEGRSAV